MRATTCISRYHSSTVEVLVLSVLSDGPDQVSSSRTTHLSLHADGFTLLQQLCLGSHRGLRILDVLQIWAPLTIIMAHCYGLMHTLSAPECWHLWQSWTLPPGEQICVPWHWHLRSDKITMSKFLALDIWQDTGDPQVTKDLQITNYHLMHIVWTFNWNVIHNLYLTCISRLINVTSLKFTINNAALQIQTCWKPPIHHLMAIEYSKI